MRGHFWSACVHAYGDQQNELERSVALVTCEGKEAKKAYFLAGCIRSCRAPVQNEMERGFPPPPSPLSLFRDAPTHRKYKCVRMYEYLICDIVLLLDDSLQASLP